MKKKYKLGLIIFLISYSLSALAVDVTVNITGQILSQGCNVKSSDLVKNIKFTDINPGLFKTVGSTSDSQLVTVRLVNCIDLNNVFYRFSGEADTIDSTLLKVGTGVTGNTVAQGLAIEVLSEDGKSRLPLNQKLRVSNVIGTTSENPVSFNLRYRSVSSNITMGDASSVLYLDFYYE